ncbi:MAG TPA: rRNA maturation RNase YbeY [Ktedonobacterales bacterium]|nr:rRNA maturation RNase YbeY [Ktedonobacterales bacterium]
MVEDGRDVQGGVEFGEEDPERDDGLEVALTFSYEPDGLTDDLFGLSEETLFTAFEQTLEMTGIERSVEASVLITTDENIRTLNRDYRGKDEATDVLSFPLLDEPLVDAPADQLWQPGDDEPSREAATAADEAEESDGDGGILEDEDEDEDEAGGEEGWPLHLGDIAIARETVIRQAEHAGHSAAHEVAFLFVHGVLHLIGYDDQTDAGYRAMVAIQEAVLARVGIVS